MNVSQHPLDDKLLLGRYRVVRLLGEGGMGTVHLARVEGAEGFTRPVVVKRMRREIRSTDEGNRLFIREAKILSRLQHPAIVGISDFGIEDGAHIMVLEYVHGYSLSSWLHYRREIERPLPIDLCVFIIRRTLEALHYAHHFGSEDGQELEIVHRDVAPDNVLISNGGFVHLLDFGIASIRGSRAEKPTDSGAFRGKLGYADPETIQGRPATPNSDQYSTAVVLYEMLTQEGLFMADSMGETIVRMVNQIPEPASARRADVPPGLDQVLARALAKDPARRFDSCAAFSRALRPFQGRDDDDVAQELLELVRVDFQALPQQLGIEPLEFRDRALAQVRSGARAHAALVRDTHPAPGPGADPLAAPSPASPGAGAAVPAAELLAAEVPIQRQLRRLLWGVLAMGAVLALSLGAAVSFFARGRAGTDQVIVVGGEGAQSATQAAPRAGAPEPEPASAPAAPRADSVPAREPVATSKSSREPRAKAQRNATNATAVPTSENESGALQQKLAGAVQQQSGAFQDCFTVHLKKTGGEPAATLHFSVAKKGGTAQVNIEPPAIGVTPLGTCLEKAGRRVQFPALANEVSFRVPVRARVTRVAEPK
jgi:tRNA A-37 threonylcarbamoyl transferase component Bud32